MNRLSGNSSFSKYILFYKNFYLIRRFKLFEETHIVFGEEA